MVKIACLSVTLISAAFLLLAVSLMPVNVEGRKLLKLAAAAAIIRGGPIIPIPIRYPVHAPKEKVVHVPVEHHHGDIKHGIW